MADATELSSRIARVEVYRGQALVTREARLVPSEADAGALATVRVARLPLLLRDDSVRVRMQGDAGPRVADLHLELDLGRRDSELRTEDEESLRVLYGERMEATVQRELASDRVDFLESLAPSDYRAADLPERLAFEERHQVQPWLDLSASVRDQLVSARGQIRQLDCQLRQINDRIGAARDRILRQSAAEAEALAMTRKAARLQLEHGAGGEVTLALSYLVPGARWVPEYELRVMDGKDAAELVLKAQVGQCTGEDWSGVELSFSTADLERSAELPRLDSWRIGKAQPPPESGWRQLPEATGELFEAYDRGVQLVSPPPVAPAPALPEGPRLGGDDLQPETLEGPAELAVQRLVSRAAQAPRSHTSDNKITGEFAVVADALMEAADEFAEDYSSAEAELEDDLDAEQMEWADEETPTSPAPAEMARADAPTQAMEPAAAMKKSRSLFSRRAPARPEPSLPPASFFAPQAAAGAQGAQELTRIAAAREALAYEDLRLQGPQQEGRGQLRATGRSERLAEQLERVAPAAAQTLRQLPGDAVLQALGARAGHLEGFPDAPEARPGETAGHFAVRYSMESPGQVLANGQPHLLTLVRRRGTIQRVFRCVPLQDPKVYQMALFENPLGLPLLAGPVRIYREGDFVVSSPLAATPPGRSVTVNLGVEPGISVARNTRFTESTHGLFGGDTALEHKVEIEVQSNLSRAAQVEVFERVPVSYDDDIEVKLLKVTPEAETYNQKDRGQIIHGGKKFAFCLEPGQARCCTLEYRITIPSKLVLEGGNRRD